MLPYRIVIPSRARVHNIRTIRQLFPDAWICVDERETEAYARGGAGERLWVHPPLPHHYGGVVRWIIDHTREPALFLADDDIRQVVCLVGRRPRKIRDWAAVRAIIETHLQLAEDLGVSVFSFSRLANPLTFASYDPFGLSDHVDCAWGLIRGNVSVDATAGSYVADDLLLSALLADRVVLVDRRYYFDAGPTGHGAGGLQGMRTLASEQGYMRHMREKWGRWVVSRQHADGDELPYSLRSRVPRKADLATR